MTALMRTTNHFLIGSEPHYTEENSHLLKSPMTREVIGPREKATTVVFKQTFCALIKKHSCLCPNSATVSFGQRNFFLQMTAIVVETC